MKDKHCLYTDLAWLFPMISPPEDYVEEAKHFCKVLQENAHRELKTLLHLGCGAGHYDKTLKKYFQVTGLDISEEMLDLARQLNPQIEYLSGDMRTTNLEKTFDVVVAFDSINYMCTERDLRAVFETAYEHLDLGGIFLTYVEEEPQSFEQNSISCSTHSQDDVEVVFIENKYDPDLADTFYELNFLFLIRERGELRIEHDCHVNGIFPLDIWMKNLRSVGFDIKVLHFEEEGKRYPLLVCLKK